MKKILLILMITLILITFCGCGYLNSLNEIPFVPMTEEEIKLAIQKKFYDENGEPRVEKWKENNYFRNITDENMKAEILQNTGKDGFEFSKIKNMLNGEEEFFLVEFKPYGHLIDFLRQNKNKYFIGIEFYPYPSPYKILEIPHENRYLTMGILKGLIREKRCCTLKEGRFVTIENEADSKFFKDKKFTCYEKYDFNTKEWRPYYLNEETNEWIPYYYDKEIYKWTPCILNEETKKWERYDKETNSWIPIE